MLNSDSLNTFMRIPMTTSYLYKFKVLAGDHLKDF